MSTHRLAHPLMETTPSLLARSLSDGQEFLLAVHEMIDLLQPQQNEEAPHAGKRKDQTSNVRSDDLVALLRQSAVGVAQTIRHLSELIRDASLKAAKDNATLALRAAADAGQRATDAKLAADAAHAAATEAKLAAKAAHAAVAAVEADVEAVAILEEASHYRDPASPSIDKDDLNTMVVPPTLQQSRLLAASSSSAFASDQAPRRSKPALPRHDRKTERRADTEASDWIEGLDGPADSFPCGITGNCGNAAGRGSGRPSGDDLQVCCFVQLRKRGVGAQLRAHFKGYPAKWNQWISAARARILAPELAAACEAKFQDCSWNSLKRPFGDTEAKPSQISPTSDVLSLAKASARARERYFRACLKQAKLESEQDPVGPFGDASNQRALEGGEIDSLIEHSIGHSHPILRPHLRHLLACSINQWEDIHMAQLVSMLSVSEIATPQAAPSASSSAFASPLVIVLPLQITEDSAHHWVSLFIHTGSKEFVLVDPLQPPSMDQDGDSTMQNEDPDHLGPGREWLQPIQATLRRRLSAASFRRFRWRSLCLGVQTDDYSCGVWVLAIWKEWMRLATSTFHSSDTDDRARPSLSSGEPCCLPGSQLASSSPTLAHSQHITSDLRHLTPALCEAVDILAIRQESSTILYPCDQS